MPEGRELVIRKKETATARPPRETKRRQSVELCKRRGELTEFCLGLVMLIFGSEDQQANVRFEEMSSPLHLVAGRLQVVFTIMQQRRRGCHRIMKRCRIWSQHSQQASHDAKNGKV